MEDDQNGGQPKWKRNETEDEPNLRRPKWKTTRKKDD